MWCPVGVLVRPAYFRLAMPFSSSVFWVLAAAAGACAAAEAAAAATSAELTHVSDLGVGAQLLEVLCNCRRGTLIHHELLNARQCLLFSYGLRLAAHHAQEHHGVRRDQHHGLAVPELLHLGQQVQRDLLGRAAGRAAGELDLPGLQGAHDLLDRAVVADVATQQFAGGVGVFCGDFLHVENAALGKQGRVVGVVLLHFVRRGLGQVAGDFLQVGLCQDFAPGQFQARHHFGRALQLVFGGLGDGELLVDQLLQRFAAQGGDLLGRGARRVGAAQCLVDLVHGDFLVAHLGRDLGRRALVVLVAAGAQAQAGQGDRSDAKGGLKA